METQLQVIQTKSRDIIQVVHNYIRWYPVPQREVDRRGGDRSLPMRSPTMAGGLFSIDRDYFYEIGAYDSGIPYDSYMTHYMTLI